MLRLAHQLAMLTACLASSFDSPYKMTFASADPVNAAKFVVKYLGGEEVQQPHKGGDGECAMIKWVEFPGTNPTGTRGVYQFHFVKAFNYPNGSMTLDNFEARMASLHGNFSSYDQFMDFHVTLGTTDLDPLAGMLHRDGVPLLVRQNGGNFSLFFEVPHGIVLEVVAPKLTVLTPGAWDRCSGPRRPMGVHVPKLQATAQLPPVWPLRAVYASADPAAEAEFMERYFDGTRVSDAQKAEAALGPGNGTCYEAHAVRYLGEQTGVEYELWWVRSAKAKVGNFSIEDYENYLRALHHLHGEPTSLKRNYDEYMDNHVALYFGDTNSIVERLMTDNVSFFLVNQYGEAADLFLQGPSGQTYEILAQHLTVGPEQELWDLCAKPQLETMLV